MISGPLDSDEVRRVHSDVIVRIRRVLERYDLNPQLVGLSPRLSDQGTDVIVEPSECEQPLLDFGEARDGPFFPGLKAASVDSRVPFGPRADLPLQGLRDPDLAKAFESAGWSIGRFTPPLVVNSNGFSLHAATLVPAGQRDRLEKLCRYLTRPALCLDRLDVREDGMISWSLRKVWRNGTRSFLFTPYEFIAKLSALVPHPGEHQLTYHGVLAPASPLRGEVVPGPAIRREASDTEGDDSDQEYSDGLGPELQLKGQPYISWAEVLKRMFGETVLRRPRCRGRRHMISVITEAVAKFL